MTSYGACMAEHNNIAGMLPRIDAAYDGKRNPGREWAATLPALGPPLAIANTA